jgi:hypothetical protein
MVAHDKISNLERELSTTRKLLFHQQTQVNTNSFSVKEPADSLKAKYPLYVDLDFDGIDDPLLNSAKANSSPSIYPEMENSPLNPIYTPKGTQFPPNNHNQSNSHDYAITYPQPRSPSKAVYLKEETSFQFMDDQEKTMERISRAREQVSKLQKRVEEAQGSQNRVEDVQGFHNQTVKNLPQNKIYIKNPYSIPTPDLNTGKLNNSTAFDELERVAASPQPRSYSASNQYESFDKPISPHNMNNFKDDSIIIEQEIFNDRLEIKKNMEKSIKKKNLVPTIPAWERVGNKKPAKNRSRVNTRSLSQFEPSSVDDPVGREMPFIVGQVFSF